MFKKIIPIILLSCLIFAFQAPLLAAEDGDDNLHLLMDDAVLLALRCSISLEKAQLNTDIAEQDKGDMAGIWHPSFITDYNPAADELYQAMPALDFAVKAARKNEEIAADQTTAETYKKYYDVILAVDALHTVQKSYTSAQNDYELKKLHLQAGKLSLIEYQTASINLASSKADFISVQNNLENAYIAFNQLIGLDLAERAVLTEVPLFTNLELINVDSTIRSIVNDSPTQWLAKEEARLKKRLSNAPGSMEQDEIEAEQYDLDADTAYENALRTVYQIYYGIKDVEKIYQTACDSLSLAEKTYQLAQLHYDMGMITHSEVLAAEASLAETRHPVLSLTCEHNLMKIFFEKPWCAAVIMDRGSTYY